jgi:hypothetical protein
MPETSPMLREAQRDQPNAIERQQVTRCLLREYDQLPILASMGSLAPCIHETSLVGFSVRHYLHEGIGLKWSESLVSARRHAGGVLIEERAEGGDVLARLRDQSAAFLDGFERMCEGGGVALYRRIAANGPKADED